MDQGRQSEDSSTAAPDRWSTLDARARAAISRFRPADGALSSAVIRFSAAVGRWIMTRRNRTVIEGIDRFLAAQSRGGRGLLTFSNHVSLLDDPLLIACLPLGAPDTVRWVAADAFNFFGGPLRGAFFGAGRCVPIVRGAGEDQPGFAFLRDRLLAGEWVHIFPEGGRTRDEGARMRRAFKSGIGRLLDETRPLALPFYHEGMQRVLPIGARLPARGQLVRLRFGEIVDCDAAFVDATSGEHRGRARWESLAGWAHGVLRRLEDAMCVPDRPEVDAPAP